MEEKLAKRLIDDYADLILRISTSYLRSSHDAEDICQTVFVKYITNMPDFATAEHERAWIIRTTVNACKDVLRSAHRRRTVLMEDMEPVGGASAAAEEREELWSLLDSLPAPQRVSIYLYYHEGYSIREVAAMLKKSEHAVAAYLSRGRRRLRELLTENEMEGGYANE